MDRAERTIAARMPNPWEPQRYLKFRAERRQPYEDLLELVRPGDGMRAVDLGCGPGELTADLAQRLALSSVVGIDHSPTMLARAQSVASDTVSFVDADIAHAPLPACDLVFSNAALHWLPEHAAVFERLRDALVPGGQLAVQMPNNFAQPTHTTAAGLAAEPPYAGALGGLTAGAAVESAEFYATLLHSLGFAYQVVQERVYVHELPGPQAVVEWVKGSMLTWYEAQLGLELYASFSAEYERRLLARLSQASPFVLTYRRILLWAQLP